MDFVREANAIVSAGNRDDTVELPVMANVLGGKEVIIPGVNAAPGGRFSVSLNSIYGSTNQCGFHNISALQY